MPPKKRRRRAPLSPFGQVLVAVSKGDEACLRSHLAAAGTDVNVVGDMGTTHPMTVLTTAACYGHLGCVRLVLGCEGTHVNKALPNGVTALYLAAIDGYTEIVRLLLGTAGIDVNAAEDDGTSPLFAACIFDRVGAIDALLERQEIKVNAAQTTTGRTPLIEAVVQGHVRTIERLLAHPGVDVNQPTLDGSTALMAAAQLGSAEITALLLAKRGVDVNMSQTKGGATPLTAAAQCGHAAVVRLLLAHTGGVAVNACEKNGETALFLAAKNKHVDVVRALLNADGIKVNTGASPPPTQNLSPLHVAAIQNHEEISKLLIEDGRVDLNAEARFPFSTAPLRALDLAVHTDSWAAARAFRATQEGSRRLQMTFVALCREGKDQEAVAMLQAGAVDVAASMGVQGTVLCSLVQLMTSSQTTQEVRERQKRILDALVQAPDVDVNFRGTLAGPPVCIAALDPHGTEVLRRLLVVPGVDVNATKPWRTEMLTAEDVESNNSTKIDWERPGYTALYLASFGGFKDTVALLLQTAGVDCGLCDADGLSPLQVAENRSHDEIVEVLRGNKRFIKATKGSFKMSGCTLA
uniref:Uncharacterized protein n=1 Tax=Zooxanthella nutricula TaxID=1333877 RepID=A0A6U6NK58_9DINO|mmetsp:Transcript_498/g.1551  ORF Transcript_498/g.1551 Transcript_498/m.1551 type:complete len:579 (+) Transcript_498:89-1825(+)